MRGEIRTLLTEFVGWRTMPGYDAEKGECLRWITDRFLHTDLPIDRGEVDGAPYLLVKHPDPKLLWFAHIDVVPADDAFFSLEEDTKSDRFLGRGVKDMKGAALCFLLAYRDLLKEGTVPPVDILFTSDEETAGRTIPALLGRGLSPSAAFTPDTGSNPHIVVEHKGVIWADLTVRGRGGHAAMPWSADNPVARMSAILSDVATSFSPDSSRTWTTTVTPAMIRGSDARNQIPCACTCSLDIRFPPEEAATPEEALQNVRKILPDDCVLDVISTASPLRTDPDHPLIRLMKSLGEEVTGEAVEIGREHGASDARYFGEQGIPAFLYGPVGGDLHAPTEWVSVSSLEQHYAINRHFLGTLAA